MKLIDRFSRPANPEWFIELLSSWKLWALGAILGAVIGLGFNAVFPGDYVAAASVMIDQNVEQVIPIGRDSDLFLYLARETRKLDALAWSDDVLNHIVESVPGFSLNQLREEHLDLSPPGDGEWHFVANHSDAEMAEELARSWALGFEKVLLESAEVSIRLERLRAGLLEEVQKEPLDWEAIQVYLDGYFAELEDTSGVSPYLEIEMSQLDEIQAEPVVSTAMALLIGSVLGFAVMFVFGMVKLTEGE